MSRPCSSDTTRAFHRFLVAAMISVLGAAAMASARQDPKPAPPKPVQEQNPPPQAEQQPTFRTEANFVRVDVYPTADGRPVPDLQQADFEVYEDGKRQEVRTFERVLIQAGATGDARPEPASVQASRDMAADPRARLFVLFLDTYHVSRDGAWNVRRSIARLLDRTIAPNDLVAVMTPEMSAASLSFTRRTGSIEELLDRWMVWGRRHEEVLDSDAVEARYQFCYPPKVTEEAISSVASELIARRRESLTLAAMRDLIIHLQGIREERKAILTVSEGWALYRPSSELANFRRRGIVGLPGVGTQAGSLSTDDPNTECDRDRLSLSAEDHDRDFRDLLDEANRANASFYTIDPRGLPVFDSPVSKPLTLVSVDSAALHARQDTLSTLAAATDGLAVMNSNDIDKGLKRVVEDLSSYYLLGYYSTNAKPDGKFHSITVKVTRPGVQVRARRGYRSITKEELASMARGKGANGAKAEATPATRAVNGLAKIRPEAAVHATAGYEWLPGENGAAKPSLWVALELDPSAGSANEQWKAGADVSLSVLADRTPVTESRQTLKREARSTLVHLPVPDKLPGDYAIKVMSKPTGALLGSTETLRVVVPRPADESLMFGQPLLYRRGPFSGPAWQVAGDPRYRRQERVKVELPVTGAFASAEVRLLDRNGKPLSNVPVISATRDENGQKVVSGEVTLAPLTTGDYVLETTIHVGNTTRTSVAAFRIIP